MLIVYASDDEMLICTPDSEPQMLLEYFEQGGRDLEDFDREVRRDGVINITPRLKVTF